MNKINLIIEAEIKMLQLMEQREFLIKEMLKENQELFDEGYVQQMLGMELNLKNAEKKIKKRAEDTGLLNVDESWTPGTELWNNRIKASIALNDSALIWEGANQLFSNFGGDKKITIAELNQL